jgi:hypothetical protein
MKKQRLFDANRSRRTRNLRDCQTKIPALKRPIMSAMPYMNCTLSKPLAEELTQAIRCHWCLEFNNWIRDVTYNKDNIKTKSGNHSQIMALLRRLAIEPIRKTSPKNFYEKDVCSYSKALAVPIS